MIIDGKSIVGKDRERVNVEFSRAWNMAREVSLEDMIHKWMFGPECQELTLGGELWLVCDTDRRELDDHGDVDTSAVMIYWNELHSEYERWICDRPLFELVAKLSPLESCASAEARIRKLVANSSL